MSAGDAAVTLHTVVLTQASIARDEAPKWSDVLESDRDVKRVVQAHTNTYCLCNSPTFHTELYGDSVHTVVPTQDIVATDSTAV